MTSHLLRSGLILLSLSALCVSTGCILSEKDVDPKPPIDKPHVAYAKISGSYISGHLGNYDSCPDDAYTTATSSGSAGQDHISGKGAGACELAEDGSGCKNIGSGWYGGGSCEDGQITLDLENTGNATGTGIVVQEILLLDAYGTTLATLPVGEVKNVGNQTDFNGSVAESSKKTIRVTFQAPAYPESLLRQPRASEDAPLIAPCSDVSRDILEDDGFYEPPVRCGGGGSNDLKIKVIFSVDRHPDVSVESKAVSKIQNVAT